MNQIMYITCSLSNMHFVREFAFSVFFLFFFSTIYSFCQIKDIIQMIDVKWWYYYGHSNLMCYLIESKVVTNTLIDMALHVSPSTDKRSLFVAQN